MRFFFSSPLIYRLLRFILGAVFIYSGLSKSMDLVYFSGIIDAFGLLPKSLSYPAGVAIVAMELILGIGLIFDIKGSLAGILILLLGFMAVAGYAIFMGYDIDCGCFGPGDPAAEAFSSLREVLYRDTVMLTCILYLYLWRYKNKTFSLALGKEHTNEKTFNIKE